MANGVLVLSVQSDNWSIFTQIGRAYIRHFVLYVRQCQRRSPQTEVRNDIRTGRDQKFFGGLVDKKEFRVLDVDEETTPLSDLLFQVLLVGGITDTLSS